MYGYEINGAYPGNYHMVYGIATPAANTHYFNFVYRHINTRIFFIYIILFILNFKCNITWKFMVCIVYNKIFRNNFSVFSTDKGERRADQLFFYRYMPNILAMFRF